MATETRTEAADQFIDTILAGWDSSDPYVATAAKGLSDVDRDELRRLCRETGSEYATAEREVLSFVRRQVAEME